MYRPILSALLAASRYSGPARRVPDKLARMLLDRFDEGAVKTTYGYRIHYKKSALHPTGIRKGVITGTYESEYLDVIERLVSPGDWVVDVGAHEGYITLFLAHRVGGDGKVFAMEPNPENLAFIRRNVEYNQMSQVEVVPRAISDKPGTANFYHNPDGGAWGSLIAYEYLERGNVTTVELDTLDRIVIGRKKPISFIKIDTEGNELKVFQGGAQLLAEDRPHLCFEVSLSFWSHLPLSVDSLFDLLRSHRYELYVLKGDRLQPYAWLDQRVINMFAIHTSRKNELLSRQIFA